MNIISYLPKGLNFFVWILFILLSTLVIRLILCIFKVKAVKQGEADYEEEIQDGDKIKKKLITFKNVPCWNMFWNLYFSRHGDLHIDDYGLSTIVGLFELVIFPILISKGKWEIIGFWLIIKTAGLWGLWQKSRTSYNRFLFGNLLSLSFAYLIYLLFFYTKMIYLPLSIIIIAILVVLFIVKRQIIDKINKIISNTTLQNLWNMFTGVRAMLISAMIGFLVGLCAVQSIIPFLSKNLIHRNELLDARLTIKSLEHVPKNLVLYCFKLKNKNNSISLEDINLVVDFQTTIDKIDIGHDEGVFDFTIGEGNLPILYNASTTVPIPTNHRNIKIRRLFPQGMLGLNCFIDTKHTGYEAAPNTGFNPNKTFYKIEYSYQYLGATIRRNITGEVPPLPKD